MTRSLRNQASYRSSLTRQLSQCGHFGNQSAFQQRHGVDYVKRRHQRAGNYDPQDAELAMLTMSSEYSIYLYRDKVDLRKGTG